MPIIGILPILPELPSSSDKRGGRNVTLRRGMKEMNKQEMLHQRKTKSLLPWSTQTKLYFWSLSLFSPFQKLQESVKSCRTIFAVEHITRYNVMLLSLNLSISRESFKACTTTSSGHKLNSGSHFRASSVCFLSRPIHATTYLVSINAPSEGCEAG